jgi:RHS repeat-associated protein
MPQHAPSRPGPILRARVRARLSTSDWLLLRWVFPILVGVLVLSLASGKAAALRVPDAVSITPQTQSPADRAVFEGALPESTLPGLAASGILGAVGTIPGVGHEPSTGETARRTAHRALLRRLRFQLAPHWLTHPPRIGRRAKSLLPRRRVKHHTPRISSFIHVSSTTYTTNTEWTLANSPYVLDGNVTVAAGVTLTIDPGVIVKFNGNARQMYVNGTLNAVGTATSHIVFTSYQDDSAGGDTNGDGSATTGAPGQWYAINVSGSGSQFAYTDIRYGGYGSAQAYAPVYIYGSGHSASLDHATITNNQQSGIVVGGRASATITNSILSNNNYGLYVDSATATVDHTTIANNSARGVWFNLPGAAPIPPASAITNSDVTGNTSYGILIYANGDYPLASMPTGTGDNIYASNSNGTQLYVSGYPSFKNADVNWRGNYWGDGVYYWYGSASCSGSSPYSSGHLAYRSSSGNVPAGPLGGGSYTVGSSWCGYDYFKLGDCDFYATKLDGSPHQRWCQTFGSLNGKNPTENLADPVNSATGSFNHAEADLALPGIGAPFGFTRSYDSLDVTTGELGQGWTDSFAASLIIKPNGDVTVHGEDGQQVDYAKQPDGSFVGAAGSLSTLASVAGGYDLTRTDQVKQHFDSQGRLQSILDRNGQGLTLSYGTDGKISSVADASGRVISFTHNTAGLLTKLTMPDTSSVNYGYTNGQLTSYTDQNAKVWTYTYDSHGFLASETDPIGHRQFLNTYGNDGRVTQQVDALNQTTTFSWDATTQTQTVTDPRGNSRKDVYASNVLTKRIDAVGNTTQLGHNSGLDATSSTLPTGGTTTMTYDARGNMLTAIAPPSLGSATKTFTYNAANEVTSITDARGKFTTYGYDTNGNNTSVVQDGHTLSQTIYNAAGEPTSTTDGNGQTTTNTYDAYGNLTSSTDALSHKTTYTYDAAGRVLTKVDPRGNEPGANPADFTTSYTYDAAGNKLTETDPLGHTTSYTYDAAGNKTSETDARGNTTTYVYDNRNELSSMTGPDPDGGGPLAAPVTTYTYDVAGDQLTVTDPLDHTTTKTYDNDKRLASVTTPMGEKTTYAYDANGNLASVVDPRGNLAGANPDDFKTTYTYDETGRQLRKTDPLGHATTNTYDTVGNLTTVTDGNGQTTTKSYDGQNRLSSVTGPDGGVTSYTYDGAGNQLTETDPLGQATTSAYDSAGHLTSVTTPLGHTTSYGYDADGNKATTTDPLGHITTDSYDADGHLLSETDALGHATAYTYDATGNRLTTTDANGHVTSYAYDPLGRLTSVTAPDGGVTSYTYDAAGNKLSRTDANGHTTFYTYDQDNRQTSLTAPLGRIWTYAYDATGNQIAVTDANGSATQTVGDGTTSSTYDADNQLIATNYSDSTPDVGYSYDGVGNRLSMTDGSGTVNYTYDSLNRLTQATRGTDSFSYSYDLVGDVTRRTYPDGTQTSYTYDADSHMATATSGGQTTSYAYDAAGELTQTTLPAANGYVETRTYDPAGRVVEVENRSGTFNLSSFTYTLDPVGNPIRIIRTGTLPETQTLTYDANDRLTSVCYQELCSNGNDPHISYTYDQVGNRLTESRASGTTTYSYNAADELTQAGSASFTYDEDGNELSADGRTFSYDLASRVASTASGGTTTSYGYDGDGNRVRATTGLDVTNYLWDINSAPSSLALERDSTGALIRRYVYGVQRISLNTGSSAFYYHYDRLGSVVELTSDMGAVQRSYLYDPFGALRAETQESPNAPMNPMKYAGELLDPASGLYFLHARDYDSSTGRLLTIDPVSVINSKAIDESIGRSSYYVYVADRPSVLVDPTGLMPADPLDKADPVLAPFLAPQIPSSPGTTDPNADPNGRCFRGVCPADRMPHPWGISSKGIQFTSVHEGGNRPIYNDPDHNCTIGIGHLIHLGPCTATDYARYRNYSPQQRIAIFRHDIVAYQADLNTRVRVTLYQFEYDALFDFAFNLGTGQFNSSTALRVLNQRRYGKVGAAMLLFKQPRGRRCDEVRLFNTGRYTDLLRCD